MELEREDTSYAIADDIVLKEQPKNFERSFVVPPMSNQILVRDKITRIPFHIEAAMTRMVLEAVMAQHEEVDNRLSANLSHWSSASLRRSHSPRKQLFVSRKPSSIILNKFDQRPLSSC